MKWLLRLYPRDWRRRYGGEMEAMLAEMRPGPHEIVDLLRGAIDARLHPQGPRRRRHGRVRRLLVALAVVASPLGSAVLSAALSGGAWRPLVVVMAPDGTPLRSSGMPVGAALLLAACWAMAAVVGLTLRSAALTRFCALVASRFVADGVLLLAVAVLATRVAGLAVAPALLDLLTIAAWSAFAALVLRPTGLPRPLTLAIGCALELVAGGTAWSLPAALAHAVTPSLLEPLRITAWAAALTVLSALRRRRRGWDSRPPDETGVPAGPRPGAPPALAAGTRLDDGQADRLASRG